MKKIVVYYGDNVGVFRALAAVADSIAQGKQELVTGGAKVKLNKAEGKTRSYKVIKTKEARK